MLGLGDGVIVISPPSFLREFFNRIGQKRTFIIFQKTVSIRNKIAFHSNTTLFAIGLNHLRVTTHRSVASYSNPVR